MKYIVRDIHYSIMYLLKKNIVEKPIANNTIL